MHENTATRKGKKNKWATWRENWIAREEKIISPGGDIINVANSHKNT